MLAENLKKALRFYYLTDENAPGCPPVKQVEIALQAGASMIQYRHKSFSAHLFEEVQAIRNLCKCHAVPLIINDNILMAKAVGADGVHLGQEDENPALAGSILGPEAIVGISVSNLEELSRTDLSPCDYIGTGPVFPTSTKKDAKAACGLEGLESVINASPIPVVAIGGINADNARSCLNRGAEGVAVISYISRTENQLKNALRLGTACGVSPRPILSLPWQDEFGLINTLLEQTSFEPAENQHIRIGAGDDACLLRSIKNPVISTDTQKEGIHFRLDWQSPEEIGQKAVEVTFSDLAASYARPVCLFVNLALPSYISERTVESFYRGIKTALIKYDCALGGGNISRAGELSLDLFAIGRGHTELFPMRAAARPGDGLYCTGPLGLARAGLDSLKRKDLSFKELLSKFKNPVARFDAAEVLAGRRVTCLMDISDGLAGDTVHIARASDLTIEFELSDRDYHPALLAYCQKHGLSPKEMVLAGGEDYELLFACPPETFDGVKTELPPAFKVGRCIPFTGRFLSNLPGGIFSFQHGGT